MNEAGQQPAMNLSLARVYLRHSDPLVSTRTWQTVLEEIIRTKTGNNQTRWMVMAKSKWMDPIRHRLLIETQAEHLLHVLQCGKVSINVYLRRMHNFAIDMNWLPASVLPKRQWPAVKFKERRGVTLEEHQKIIAAEVNLERKAFYQLCWHLGGSQGDIASLTGEDVDWENGTVCDGESGPQQQGGASSLCKKGVDENSIVGGLRTAGSAQGRITLTPIRVPKRFQGFTFSFSATASLR